MSALEWEQDRDGEWQARATCGHVANPDEIEAGTGRCVNCADPEPRLHVCWTVFTRNGARCYVSECATAAEAIERVKRLGGDAVRAEGGAK